MNQPKPERRPTLVRERSATVPAGATDEHPEAREIADVARAVAGASTSREGAGLDHAARSASARGMLAVLSLAVLLSSLGTSIANVGLPTLAQVFGASFQAVQWVVLAYLLAITTLIVSVGRLGDLVGRRRLLLAGILVFTAASVLGGVAPTLGLLIAARAVQGLGAAVMMALSLALVGEAVSKNRTGRAMGLLGTMSAVGTALGPTLGGLLTAGFGWRALFLLNLPLGLATYLLGRRCLPVATARTGTERKAREAFDHAGTLLLAVTLAAYALAMTWGRGRFGVVNLVSLLVAGGGAGFFLWVEARAASPLVRWALLREPGLKVGLATSALVATVLMATLVVGPFYLSGALGLAAGKVGLVLSVGPLAAALIGVPAGRWVDRLGASRVTKAGLAGIAGGCGALALLPLRFGVAGYVGAVVVVTAGYALFQTANNTGVMSARRAEERGVVSGLLNLSRNLGLITGASLMGAIFAFATGSTDLAAATPEALAGGLRATFAVATLLVGGAFALTWRSGPEEGSVALTGAANPTR